MSAASSVELARILRGCLNIHGQLKGAVSVNSANRTHPQSLHDLCLRTAAIYATTSLYEFHDNKIRREDTPYGLSETLGGHTSSWEEVLPLLDQHFLQLVPTHLYENFLDHVLCALEVAGHFDAVGKKLMRYITLFFPKHMRRFRAQRYTDRVLMPIICCLHQCTAIEELYLEHADSGAITTYLLAHLIKHLKHLKVLALPKQCDDDVASIIGINCPRLESLILTGTNMSNVGLSWLLCCKNLHTIIMPGFFQGITPKGVALLLYGLPKLKHVIYDAMSDVLTYIDFNTSDAILPRFGLKTVLFHSMELLSSNHLELITKLCPTLEWLSLDSALFFNLEGLGRLPKISLLRLNYKSRPIDQTVVDFFSLNGQNLVTLHLFEVKDLRLEDFHLTLGQCSNLENLVMCDCSVVPDWDRPCSFSDRKPLCKTVVHLQLFNLQILPAVLVKFLSMFRDLHVLEMDHCDLDLDQMKRVLLDQSVLHTLRCTFWTHISAQNVTNLQMSFRNRSLQMNRQSFSFDEDRSKTMAASLLAEYADFSPVLNVEALPT